MSIAVIKFPSTSIIIAMELIPDNNVYLKSHLKYISAKTIGTPKSKYIPYPIPVDKAKRVITMNTDVSIAASVNFLIELFNFMPPKTFKLILVSPFFKLYLL